MSRKFFSRRVPFFGNVAMLVMCAVFFFVPFVMRGARLAIDDMRNDVSDWLPGTFEETKQLKWFRQHFVGDQIVVISWPGCNEEDPRYQLLVEKLRAESVKGQQEMLSAEALEAHEKYGDELGLHTTGNYHEDFGAHREKWLMGKDKQWFWINRKGQLFRWNGQNNVVEGGKRAVERFLHGTNKATGFSIAEFDEQYYQMPTMLAAAKLMAYFN